MVFEVEVVANERMLLKESMIALFCFALLRSELDCKGVGRTIGGGRERTSLEAQDFEKHPLL